MYVENLGALLRSWRTQSPTRIITANVVFLGVTSLITDISSEMVSATLPLYLVFGLGLTPLEFGLIDGLYQGFAAVVRVGSGLVSDQRALYKQVAVVGYALSAVCKLAILLVGATWAGIVGVILVDRMGKGIRTSPRDALISLSVHPEALATAFGVHRALDTTGAMLGPLIAFALLTRIPGRYDTVFVASFCFAIVGVAILVLFVKNRRDEARSGPRVSLAATTDLLRQKRFRGLVVASGLLGAVTVSDGFIYLATLDRVDFNSNYLPLLFVGTALVYLVLAVPAGWLADRAGRLGMLLSGYALMIPIYLLLLTPSLTAVGLAAVLLLLGAFYAATDGVLMALASTVVPPSIRGGGMAIVTTSTSLSRLAASFAFGALWTFGSLDLAILVFAIAFVGVLVVAVSILRGFGEAAAVGPLA